MPRKTKSTRRKEPSQERARATIDALVEAAARVLAEEGYEAATTNRVAEVAGASIGTLYQYFENKDALVAAVAEREMQTALQRFEDFVRGTDDVELLVTGFVRALVETTRSQPALHRVLVEEMRHSAALAGSHQVDRRATEVFAEFLERAHVELVNPRLAAFLVVHAVRYGTLAYAREVDEPFDPEEFVREMTRMVLGYLLPHRRA